jgi:hypothetical protein
MCSEPISLTSPPQMPHIMCIFRVCHWEDPGKPVGLKLNGTQQQLVYADDVNLLGDIVTKNTRTLTLLTR